MKSHKVISSAVTFTRNTRSILRFTKIIILTNNIAATNAHFVTFVATNPEGNTEILTFSALVGEYCGPFEFTPSQTVVVTPATDTIVLLENFSFIGKI